MARMRPKHRLLALNDHLLTPPRRSFVVVARVRSRTDPRPARLQLSRRPLHPLALGTRSTLPRRSPYPHTVLRMMVVLLVTRMHAPRSVPLVLHHGFEVDLRGARIGAFDGDVEGAAEDVARDVAMAGALTVHRAVSSRVPDVGGGDEGGSARRENVADLRHLEVLQKRRLRM